MMTVEEIEAAMIEYEEKSALLPMPKNAEEHRDAVMMLDSLRANQAADVLADSYSDHSATKLHRRGLLSPFELWIALQA
jgi:hypothetical protein